MYSICFINVFKIQDVFKVHFYVLYFKYMSKMHHVFLDGCYLYPEETNLGFEHAFNLSYLTPRLVIVNKSMKEIVNRIQFLDRVICSKTDQLIAIKRLKQNQEYSYENTTSCSYETVFRLYMAKMYPVFLSGCYIDLYRLV